jgi:hypothetical protein
MVSDNFVAALAILFIFGAPMAAWVVSRVLAHNERMAMIRQGIIPPNAPASAFRGKVPPPPAWGPPPPPGAYAPPPGPHPGIYPGFDDYYAAQIQMRKGIRLTMIGVALLVGLGSIGSFNGHYFGPWLLGGLVPMFIGIGQVLTAAANGAPIPFTAQAYAQRGRYAAPPPPAGPSAGPPPGAAAPPPPPPGPYAWRPGSTPEIEHRDP